ncbi:MAG: ATPase [Tannerella sp.]|jgi:AAA+ ATPase superfamily predicted ATPase|nr:ATPase [Tannerella sp.]
MIKIVNPFITGGYIGAKYFCDRKDESEQVIRYLENGNNVTLISTRRMGKTGLIHHCFNNKAIQKGYHTFFVDIYATKSLNDFVFLLSKSIFDGLKSSNRKTLEVFLGAIKSLRPEMSFDENGMPSFSLGIGDIKRPETSLDEIFHYLKKASRPCIVAIDEFQQITNYPEKNIEALLRTYVQRCPLTRFIFAGSQRHLMGEMFVSAARPFFASTSMINLEAIDRLKYVEFARKHFRAGEKDISVEAVERVYDIFEGITWYIQKTLNVLFSETPTGALCTLEMVNDAVKFVVDSNKYTYSENMFRLPDKQGKLLIAIAKDHRVAAPTSSGFVKRHNLVSASSVQAALNGLLVKEFVTRDEAGFAVYDRFFEIWLSTVFGNGYKIY